SVTSPPFLLCSLARRVSNIAGSFLFALQQRRTFGLFGSDESLGFLCFAFGLQSEISSMGTLFGQFGLMHTALHQHGFNVELVERRETWQAAGGRLPRPRQRHAHAGGAWPCRRRRDSRRGRHSAVSKWRTAVLRR